MGQLSDPFSQSGDEEDGFTIGGLPGEPHEPDEPEGPAAAGGAAAGDADDASAAVAGAEDDRPPLVYDLDDWSADERSAITDRLADAGVAHWWVDAALHVREDDEAAVDNVLDQVEGITEPLDPDRDQVAYDLSDWDDNQVAALAAALRAAEIPYAWDGAELYAYTVDEQAADEVIDRVAHPHELQSESDDGAAGADLLGELFVAADRLQGDAQHHEAAVTLLDLDRALASAPVPYGLAERDWERLRGLADALADELRATEIDEDAAMAAAGALRSALRSYV